MLPGLNNILSIKVNRRIIRRNQLRVKPFSNKTSCTIQLISILSILYLLVLVNASEAQQPAHTFGSFIIVYDTVKFKPIRPTNNGFIRTYIISEPQIWDIDKNNTAYVTGSVRALLCFEGQLKNGKNEGLTRAYLIDSTDISKRYKLYEQIYFNDKLNGEWRTYSLRGTLVTIQTFKNELDKNHGGLVIILEIISLPVTSPRNITC